MDLLNPEKARRAQRLASYSEVSAQSRVFRLIVLCFLILISLRRIFHSKI